MRRNRRHLCRDVPWGGSDRCHFTFFYQSEQGRTSGDNVAIEQIAHEVCRPDLVRLLWYHQRYRVVLG